MTPRLTVSAFTPRGGTVPLAEIGPLDSWELEPLLVDLLARPELSESTTVNTDGIAVHCIAVFDLETPALRLSRLLIGRLLAAKASLELELRASEARLFPEARSNPDSSPRLRVEFSLETRAVFDPEAITALIGLEATSTIRAGEKEPLTANPSPTSRWKISTGDRRGTSIEPLVDELLSIVAPRRNAISMLARDTMDAVLSIVAYFSRTPPKLRLTAAQLSVVRDLGAEIDIDATADSEVARANS